MANNYKEAYLDLLSRIKRPGIEELKAWLENSDFFISPASTKYHGCYDGGLVEHCLNVYQALTYLHGNLVEGITEFNLPEISEESILIVALLHDVCKINTYVPDTKNVKNAKGVWEQVPIYTRKPLLPMGHGGKSLFIIQQFMTLTRDEALAIYWHMGAYDISNYSNWDEIGLAYNDSLLAFLLHQADMMSTYIMENKLYAFE